MLVHQVDLQGQFLQLLPWGQVCLQVPPLPLLQLDLQDPAFQVLQLTQVYLLDHLVQRDQLILVAQGCQKFRQALVLLEFLGVLEIRVHQRFQERQDCHPYQVYLALLEDLVYYSIT